MKKPAVVLTVLAVALVVFCAVFLWNPPSPRYFPIERTWRMPSEPAPGPAMGWYGRAGVALGISAVAAGIVALGLRFRGRRKAIVISSKTVYAIVLLLCVVLAITFASIVHEQRSWFSKAPALPKPDHEY